MIKPTRRKPAFKAKRIFTDRDDAKSLFEEALTRDQPPDSYRILAWHGVGGQGKTALLRELERRLKDKAETAINLPSRRRIGWALIDFGDANMRRIDGALLSLRLQLASRAGMSFPAFDTAFARHVALRNPGVDLRQRHPELFRRESELLADILNVGAEAAEFARDGLGIPGVGLLYKYASRLRGKWQRWWETRGQEILADLDELSAEQILMQLPFYFGSDIHQRLLEAKPPRIILLFDTHEALWRESGLKGSGMGFRADDWLRLLVQEACGALVTICGRDKLGWAQADDDWSRYIDERPLGALSDEDADQFLAEVPIADADIRKRIVAGAKGLPFYLDLQVDLFEDLCQAGQTPDKARFGGSHPQIVGRFLDHLSPEDEAMLRLASYPRMLDEGLLNDMAEHFHRGLASVNWKRFSHWSFITASGAARVSMHGLMREELQKREREERPDFFKRLHRWLFDRYFAEGDPRSAREVTASNEAAFHSAYIHLNAIEPDLSIFLVLEKANIFYDAMRWQTMTEILTDATAVAERLWGASDPQTVHVRRELGCIHRQAGRLDLARSIFEELLRTEEKLRPYGYQAESVTLHELGSTYFEMEEYGRAEDCFLRSLAMDRAKPSVEQANIAFALYELGAVYRATERFALAEKSFAEALDITEKTHGKEHHVYGTALLELGRVYFEQELLDKAKDKFDDALAIYRKDLGAAHPYCGRALHWLAMVEIERGNGKAARTMLEQALDGWKDHLPTDHPWPVQSREALRKLGPPG